MELVLFFKAFTINSPHLSKLCHRIKKNDWSYDFGSQWSSSKNEKSSIFSLHWNQPYCSHIKREKNNFLRNFFALRWLFTPRVPQFISLRHNMAIEIFYEIDFLVYHHNSVVSGTGLVKRRFLVQIRRRLLLKVTEISFESPIFTKKWFFICFLYIRMSYVIFHHQTISSWFKMLYPGVMSHLKPSPPSDIYY